MDGSDTTAEIRNSSSSAAQTMILKIVCRQRPGRHERGSHRPAGRGTRGDIRHRATSLGPGGHSGACRGCGGFRADGRRLLRGLLAELFCRLVYVLCALRQVVVAVAGVLFVLFGQWDFTSFLFRPTKNFY